MHFLERAKESAARYPASYNNLALMVFIKLVMIDAASECLSKEIGDGLATELRGFYKSGAMGKICVPLSAVVENHDSKLMPRENREGESGSKSMFACFVLG